MNTNLYKFLIRMSRLAVCVFFVSQSILMGFATDLNGQRKRLNEIEITVKDFNNTALLEFIQFIEAETDFYFAYQSSIVSNKYITIRGGQWNMKKLLERFSTQTQLAVRRVNDSIVLYESEQDPEVIEEFNIVEVITGTITDDSGEPIPGATIVVKGKSKGAITDINGNFSLEATSDDVLVISYLGFLTQEVKVGNQTVINVQLLVDLEVLDEVVVIGYGIAKAKNITGAVAKVDLEDSPLASAPTTNILQSLRGNMAGVNIGTQNSAGENPDFIVRGQNSINGSNAPLIVLDGVIFLGNLADINPADIAGVSVLKDASAAAAYGSRSANGVIMVNTKRGKSEKPSIRYTTTFGVNTWRNKPNLMGRDKFLEKFMVQNGFATVDDIVYDDEVSQLLLDQSDVDTDWLDLISRNGFIQEHQLSVSGRTDKMNYYFSGGYSSQAGAIVGDDFERISGRLRLDVEVTDWLEVGLDGTFNRNDYSGIGADVGIAQSLSPISAPYIYEGWPNNVNANTSTELARWPVGQSIPNPLWDTNSRAVEDVDVNDFFRFAGNALFKVPGVEGLTYKLNYSVYSRIGTQNRLFNEYYYIQEHANAPFLASYSPAQVATGLTSANGYVTNTRQNNYVVDNIVNYSKDFDKHFIDATIVATRDFTGTETAILQGRDFSENGNTVLGVNGMAFAGTQINGLDIVERRNIGYLGRVSYAYDGKYHFNASLRRDGASVFGEDNKWGNFPSIGVAWTLSEENFLNNSDAINYLKANLSFGVNGNQGVAPYGTLSRVASGPGGGIFYEFGDAPETLLFGIQQQNLGNPSLGWERTTSFNAGIQSIWLDGRVSLDMNYYYSQTTDQIFSRQIPIMNGFGSIISSLGQVDNKGLEINLSGTVLDKGDLQLNSGFNLWWNRNTVVSLYGDDLDGDGKEDDDISNNLFIGEPLGAIYGYDFIGVAQVEDTEYFAVNGGEPGDPMFRDLDGDGVITAADRKILGFADPNFRFGFSNTLTYKNLSLYVMIAGNLGGNDFYQKANPYATSFANRFDTNELDHAWWTAENRSNEYLRPGFAGQRYLGLESRGFVRIQDVILSYTLPTDLLSSIGMESLQFNATVRNLHTFTGWSGGGDPEEGVAFTGIATGASSPALYPVPTVYSMGLNVSF